MPQASIPRKGKEEGLGAPEPLVADGDDLSVRQLVGLFQGGGGGGSGHLLLEVKSNIAQLLLNVPDNLPLGSGGEGVAPLCEDLHQVVSEVTASKVKPEDGVGEERSFHRWERETPSPESMTIPVVRPEAYRERTA